jgi:hypothetical protein
MSSIIKRLFSQPHGTIAVKAYVDCLNYAATGLMSESAIALRILASARDAGVPEHDARAAIGRGLRAAHRQTERPFDDPLPFGKGSQ